VQVQMLSVLDVCCRIKAQAMRFTQGGVSAQDALAYGLTSGLVVVEQGELRFGPDFSPAIGDLLVLLKCCSPLLQRYKCALERTAVGAAARVPLFSSEQVAALVREGADSQQVHMLKASVELRSHYLAIQHELRQPDRGVRRPRQHVVAGVLWPAPRQLEPVVAGVAPEEMGGQQSVVEAQEGEDLRPEVSEHGEEGEGEALPVELVTDFAGLPSDPAKPTREHAMFTPLFPNGHGTWSQGLLCCASGCC
jgi:hypothetical protein